MVEGEILEMLGAKHSKIRLFDLDEADPLEGEKCLEVSPSEAINLSEVRAIKRKLPIGYDTVRFSDFGGRLIVEFIKAREGDEEDD